MKSVELLSIFETEELRHSGDLLLVKIEQINSTELQKDGNLLQKKAEELEADIIGMPIYSIPEENVLLTYYFYRTENSKENA